MNVKQVKVKDYFDILVSNQYVLQNPNSFSDFPRGSLEGFVSLNQCYISQKAECKFARDDVGSDSRTIEDVYRGSSYVQGIVEGGEMIRRISDGSSSFLYHSLHIKLLHILSTEGSFYRIYERNRNRWFPLVGIFRGLSKIFKKIILKFEREFRRLNFFILQSSWFRREL